MAERPLMKLTTTVLDAPSAEDLAAFYERLLGWIRREKEADWVLLAPPEGGHWLAFQDEPAYVRPVWPAGPGDQQMSVHLDIKVDDLEAAVAYAVSVGATLPDFQPQDDVRVLLDPDGHPFCFYLS
ncbi:MULTISPECIES: VOC family protein [Micromonospora]|uniref:VOC family protein n=1 Tax=Micromonospora TaxID=1873 RepID=UPI0003EECB8C|nr:MULTISPECIES: VOC family protein [Micromonospora]EWM66768.1 glyoxalase [Micromonospora sp. M42]MBQ1070463.1 VOC family protein [Micromonospora sp. D75]MCK1805932.1 VOC family protein [Micromonospora sp. R42106]MCK1830474.1 VOC family protein [Micromonospora sp. R42003]MCK1842371.1 VOC family protein [Micromonospora sp. R42004]